MPDVPARTYGPAMESATLAARARDMTKVYGHDQAAVTAIDGVDLDIRAGTFTAVMGPARSAVTWSATRPWPRTAASAPTGWTSCGHRPRPGQRSRPHWPDIPG